MAQNRSIRCLRVNVPDQANSITLPDFARHLIIKNVDGGLTPGEVRFNFAEDAADQYWTVAPGDTSPIIGVRGGEVVNTDGVGQAVTVEAIVWK